jgi:hypothetical protein
MSAKIVTPPAFELDQLPPSVAEWIRQTSRALTNGIEGTDAVGGIQTGKVTIDPVIEGVGDVAQALQTQTNNLNAQADEQNAGVGFTVSLSTSNLYAVADATGVAETNAVIATITGGTGPFNVSWATDPVTLGAATSASALTTTFERTGMATGEYVIGEAVLSVVDSSNGETIERRVSLSFSRPAAGGRSLI